MTTAHIRQSNDRLKFAIVCARIDRNPGTICEVRDAINARRFMRDAGLTAGEEISLADHYRRQLSTWGRVEAQHRLADGIISAAAHMMHP